MTEQWGRLDTAGTWPRPRPVWTLGLVLIAFLSGGTFDAYLHVSAWTPLQRIYLTLMINLLDHGEDPFWQQASTNLVRFVILLRQPLADYVTFHQVYEHVINPDRLRVKIEDGGRRFAVKNRRITISTHLHETTDALGRWT